MKAPLSILRSKRRQTCRRRNGSTIIGLLIGSVIIMFVAAAMSMVIFTNTSEYLKVFSRTDSLIAARTAIDRIGRLVRMARSLGDVQGTAMVATDPYSAYPPGPSGDAFKVNDNSVSLQQVEAGTACNTSAKFPSAADFCYNSTNGTLNSTVKSWPWQDSMVGGQYLLGPSTLIVQVQCFDQNGMPQLLSANTNLPALDTYVFNVVPDTSRAGPTQYYQLQMAVFPAPAGITNAPSLAPGVPSTICSGIVGPLDANTHLPTIFQYVKSSDNSTTTNFDDSTAAGQTNESDLLLFKGVIVNLEIMNVDGAGRPTVSTVRSELYLRNNSSATVLGPG